jgi:hypothetical protein
LQLLACDDAAMPQVERLSRCSPELTPSRSGCLKSWSRPSRRLGPARSSPAWVMQPLLCLDRPTS